VVTPNWLATMAIDFSQAEMDIGWLLLNLAAIDPSGRPAHLRAAGYAYTAARRHLSLLPDKHRDLSGLAQAADILFAELRSQEQIHGLPGGVTIALDGMGSE
jgi:hypothetical protein